MAAAYGSSPVGTVERAEAYCLGDVLRAYLVGCVEVGDGATDFKDPVVGARREPLARHGLLQQPLARGVEEAVSADEARSHLRVREDAAAAEAL